VEVNTLIVEIYRQFDRFARAETDVDATAHLVNLAEIGISAQLDAQQEENTHLRSESRVLRQELGVLTNVVTYAEHSEQVHNANMIQALHEQRVGEAVQYRNMFAAVLAQDGQDILMGIDEP
jgi:regulator of replication initiation timing